MDATLELDLARVQAAVDEYLSTPREVQRAALTAELTTLDDQLSKSDAYEGSLSGIFGFGSKGSVIGETTELPFVEEVATAEFHAQVELVRAAKLEIEAPTSTTMDALRAASQNLKSH